MRRQEIQSSYGLQAARKASGFTLLELLVTVTIIGLLMVLGFQQFGILSAKSKRHEATKGLNEIWLSQQMYYATFQKYAHQFTDLNFPLEHMTEASSTKRVGSFYEFNLGSKETSDTIGTSWRCQALAGCQSAGQHHPEGGAVGQCGIDGDSFIDELRVQYP